MAALLALTVAEIAAGAIRFALLPPSCEGLPRDTSLAPIAGADRVLGPEGIARATTTRAFGLATRGLPTAHMCPLGA
jgi:hypothetical protein